MYSNPICSNPMPAFPHHSIPHWCNVSSKFSILNLYINFHCAFTSLIFPTRTIIAVNNRTAILHFPYTTHKAKLMLLKMWSTWTLAVWHYFSSIPNYRLTLLEINSNQVQHSVLIFISMTLVLKIIILRQRMALISLSWIRNTTDQIFMHILIRILRTAAILKR